MTLIKPFCYNFLLIFSSPFVVGPSDSPWDALIFEEKPLQTVYSPVQALREARIYADRIAGGDRDHRAAGGPAASGRPQGQGVSLAGDVQDRHATIGHLPL